MSNVKPEQQRETARGNAARRARSATSRLSERRARMEAGGHLKRQARERQRKKAQGNAKRRARVHRG